MMVNKAFYKSVRDDAGRKTEGSEEKSVLRIGVFPLEYIIASPRKQGSKVNKLLSGTYRK